MARAHPWARASSLVPFPYSMSTREDSALLLARPADLLARAEKGEVAYSSFLSPREQRILANGMGKVKEEIIFDGGYVAAERARAFFLPPWMLSAEKEMLEEWLADTKSEALVALEIKGSDFRTLAHKDYLGAILNLGTERAAIGDVCVTSPHTAILFCDRIIARFLCQHLSRVANDAVTIEEIALPADFDGGRKFEPVLDTVASPRADSVVAALANLSRERAFEMLRAGLVEIDYETTYEKDAPVTEGCVITIRGKGKFLVRSLSDKTKKGRYRLVANKYL